VFSASLLLWQDHMRPGQSISWFISIQLGQAVQGREGKGSEYGCRGRRGPRQYAMHLLLHPQLFPAFAFTPSTLKGRESFSSRRGRDHCCLAVFSHYSPSSSLDRILGAPPRRTPRLYFQVKITCVTHSHTDALPSASLQKSLSGKSVRSQAAKRETKSKRIIIFVCII
jgi:hypothetical protein